MEVYPVIILNNILASTVMINWLFHDELNKRLLGKFNHLIIYPLTIMHVQDLERLENRLITEEINIWEILNKNFSDALYPRPFYKTLNRLEIDDNNIKNIKKDFLDFIGYNNISF